MKKTLFGYLCSYELTRNTRINIKIVMENTFFLIMYVLRIMTEKHYVVGIMQSYNLKQDTRKKASEK